MLLAGSTSVNVSHDQALKEWKLTFSTRKRAIRKFGIAVRTVLGSYIPSTQEGEDPKLVARLDVVKPLKTNKQTKPPKLSPLHDL